PRGCGPRSRAHGASSVSGASSVRVSARMPVAAATAERASASPWTAASAFAARCWSTAAVRASPTATIVRRASAVVAATRTTPRSRRRDTHQLQQLAPRPATLGTHSHADLAEARVCRRADLALDAETAGARALAAARLRYAHRGLA